MPDLTPDVQTLSATSSFNGSFDDLGANGKASLSKILEGGDASIAPLDKEGNSAHVVTHRGLLLWVVRKDTPAAIATADGNRGPLTTDSAQRLWTRPHIVPGGGHTLGQALISTATSGANTIATPAAGKAIYVLNYQLQADKAIATTVNLTWRTGATDRVKMEFAQGEGANEAGTVDAPLFWGAIDAALILNLDSAKLVEGHVAWIEV